LKGFETKLPPTEWEEKGTRMCPTGSGDGLEGANTKFATGNQIPPSPLSQKDAEKHLFLCIKLEGI
jgi:hypothetical protein